MLKSIISKELGVPRCVTAIYYDERLTNYEFSEFNESDAKRIKQRLARQLKRSGFVHPVIGSLEIDYHSEGGFWLPHFHLIVYEPDAPINEFRRYFKGGNRNIEGRTTKADRPVHVVRLKDRPKQISYLYKSYWSHVKAFIGRNGNRRTKKYGLRYEQLRLSLIVLERLGFSGRLFLYKARRMGSQLKTSCQ